MKAFKETLKIFSGFIAVWILGCTIVDTTHQINVSDQKAVPVRVTKVFMSPEVVKTIQINSDVPINFYRSKSSEAFVQTSILLKKPEGSSSKESFNIFDFVYAKNNSFTYSATNSLPDCDAFHKVIENNDGQSFAFVRPLDNDFNEDQNCLLSISFFLPSGYPSEIEKNGVLIYSPDYLNSINLNELNYKNLFGEARKAVLLGKESHALTQMSQALDLFRSENERFHFLKEVVPQAISADFELLNFIRTNWFKVGSGADREVILYFFKSIQEEVSIGELTRILETYSSHQQIDFMNILSSRKMIRQTSNFFVIYDFFKSIKTPDRKISFAKMAMPYLDTSSLNSEELQELIGLFPTQDQSEAADLFNYFSCDQVDCLIQAESN